MPGGKPDVAYDRKDSFMKNVNTQQRGSVKNLAISAALAIALAGSSFAMVGCGGSNESAQQKETTTQQETQPETTTEAQPTEAAATNSWTTVASAEEAAKAAGLTLFGVPASLELNDISYANPVFAQAGGLAQATYESPATQLVLRKGTEGKYTAALSDRAATEFASTWQQDVDGIAVTLLGATQGQATVLTWKDGGADYGVTWQGLGGEEMAMNEDQVATVVRAVHQANAATTQTTQQNQQQTTQNQNQNQQQTTQQNQNQQQTTQQNQSGTTQQQTSQTSQVDEDMLDSSQAASIASGYVAGDNNVSGTSAQLVTGGDAPHYVVSFHYDDADYTVTLDAYTGEIWSADQTFNDGTTYDYDADDYSDTDDANDRNDAYDTDTDDVYDTEDSQY